ncbi:MAG: 1-acyl-sn-glycerol-3-phosphate acyltransferase [Nitratireductor sp.]|nr:1-acyl-sn-glycerol-3-phosphate acyltransferase [Nitratireductor sp.]
MAFEFSKLLLARTGIANWASKAPAREPHIVDILIAERGKTIVGHSAWPILRPVLHELLHYREALRMADAIAPLGGIEALKYLSKLLDLSVETHGRENVPLSGGFLLVSNHPTGIADGIALFDAISPSRTDLSIYTNRDAVRLNRRFSDVLIPVEWRADEKTHGKARETLISTNRAIRDNRAIIIFPSGRIGFWENGRLNERPWQNSAVALACRYDLPVVPVNITGRNSWLFYWLARWNTELRDMTVFHELLNKKRKPFRVTFGKAIDPSALRGDLHEVTSRLQRHCSDTLARQPDTAFQG